ncbi:cilia- and flagella-associated protein 44-like isoform X2 [Mya arenaria]|uniref:cilia- and flagella-associated protein 44-like isoform X2 n=1 Tax=Mya arenaria TaxID=6604 RepID=UPI0022E2B4D1|nr:cilia- and flagella-associated protein 44-like isoform X2 [Mya arenaria]
MDGGEDKQQESEAQQQGEAEVPPAEQAEVAEQQETVEEKAEEKAEPAPEIAPPVQEEQQAEGQNEEQTTEEQKEEKNVDETDGKPAETEAGQAEEQGMNEGGDEKKDDIGEADQSTEQNNEQIVAGDAEQDKNNEQTLGEAEQGQVNDEGSNVAGDDSINAGDVTQAEQKEKEEIAEKADEQTAETIAEGEQAVAEKDEQETEKADEKEAGEAEKPSEGGEQQAETQQQETVAEQQSEQQSEQQPEQKSEQQPEQPATQGEGLEEVDGKAEGETPSTQEEQGPADTTQEAQEEEEVKEEEKEDEEPKIPDDFYYEYDKFASRPAISAESGLPEDMLTLQHSFGYDCMKRANLHILDEKTVLFAAGNLVLILDLNSKEQKFIRSTSGGGIGAIAVHPSRKFFAVAEKGSSPNINVFEWPTLKLHRILRGGTEKSYAFVDFNPDGTLLASQGGDPDFMLTVWDWKQEKTVLRSKAFSQDVFRCTFSTELEGQLTTSGTVHIRFWKMADTFTGLKLQGELGKFGRTEISDIEGYVELPDGKVLSGSEWGNMLLWEGGLIKVEIRMKNKKSCHTGPIQQILLDEGELMSVGIDGYIRVWDFEAIDTADATDDSAMFELDPMNELKVGTNVQLKCIIKSIDSENEPTIWYAQDAHGGIWRLDLSFSHTSSAPEKLFTFHAGMISGCDVSPVSQLAATTGHDSTVRVFDYVQQKQICDTRFASGGTSIIWMPDIVDPKGGTVVVGFEDGVVRVLGVSKLIEDSARRKKHHECSLQLLQAFKPHSKAVTSLAIDKLGETIASGSEDGTVFLMSIGDKYSPMGFLKVAGPVTQVQWSPARFERETLLVFCQGGIVQEITWPDDGKFDTSHTFEIKGLQMRSFKFASVKSKLRHEEELERKAKEEEERKKKEAEERRKRIERGLETESEQGDVEEEEKEKEPEWEPYIPDEPSPILTGFYGDKPGTIWLSMGNFDAGYLYECEFPPPSSADEDSGEAIREVAPLKAIAVPDSNDVPICTIKWSKNGQQAMFGMENGQIRIQNLIHAFDISELGPSWCLSMHDNNYGQITGLLQSYDGSMLISVGADGNFFLFSVMGQEQLDQKIAENKAKLPSAKKLDESNLPDDIEDPNAYSIEEAKQKAEHDKMMRDAEEKKKEVRRHITKMRRMFKQLLEQNESLPTHLRLHKDEFEMDREIKKELERHKADKIDVVRRELAWESEKQRIALEKLRKRFKDVVECDRIVVKAFETPHEVASFRASKLSDDFYQLKADFERRKTQIRDDMTRDPTRDLITGGTRISDAAGVGGGQADDGTGAKVSTTLKGSMGERITKALQKVEEKKKKRAERKAMWSELYATKPDDDYEDPEDISGIKEAKDNMGDYKLKTAHDYVVPDHLRMNVDKARGRLLVLKDLIHENKYEFNQRLLAMRDKKIRMIEEIRDLTSELEGVHAKLSADLMKPVPPVPEMHPDEMPEKKLEYTRETLISFKKQLADQSSQEKKGGGEGGGFGGFGGFGGGGAADKKADAGRTTPTLTQKQSTSVSTVRGQDEPDTPDDVEEELSPLEIQLREAEVVRLSYEQDRLLNRIHEITQNFDAELRLLRHDKFRLDIVMKNADLRQVTLFEELVLLKEYEKREDVLADKVTGKQQEKLDMQAKIVDVTGKLEGKKKEIERLQEKEKALLLQFQGSLGENNKFTDYLTKVFKKKIKRSKKKTTEGDDDDEDSDDDSEDDSDWDEDEDDEESEAGGYDLDICPSGCDQTLYEATCQLREKRLDIEEALIEEKKTNDTLKKELDGYGKKSKVIDNGLKTAQQDLEAFQLEKQQKLNDLDVVVSLKLHQIQYMINGILPQDLSQTLVFESNGVTRLQLRIKELEQEKHSTKKYMRESKKKHVQLIKDRRTFEGKIQEMDGECEEMMISKFGCVVDIEKLETVTVNRAIEELKEKLRMTEIQCSEEVMEWNEKLVEKKDMITDLIRENTKRLNQLSTLLNAKHGSEGSLDSRQKNLGEEYSGARKADIREKQRLIQLVQLQAQEIDALKEEIMLLSRKGGHILPPAQPPLPQSPHMRTLSN